MRICHVLTDDSGGGRVYAEALAAGAVARGAEVEWLFTGERSSDNPIAGAGAATFRSLRRSCARASLVHCHGFHAAIEAAPFSGRLVVTPHGSHLVRRIRGPRRVLALAAVRAAVRRAAVVICVGRDELDDLRPLLPRGAGNLELVLNGSRRVPAPTAGDRRSARDALAIDPYAPVLAFVARLELHKGPLLAVRTLAHVRALVPDAVLVVAGDGSLAAEMAAAAGDGVRLLGHLADPGPVLVAADAVLNTSDWEGMSLALLEAMWRARPAVAVAAAGNREVIADTGVVVDSRDPETIGAAAASLLRDPLRLEELGARARRRAELHFDEERMVEQTLALYERCLAGEGRRVRRRAAPAGAAP